MMGDTMVGWVMSLISPNEPTDLQTGLQKQFPDAYIGVADDATGGTMSSLQNELRGTDGSGQTTPQRLAQTPAVIVIEEHGLNDAYGGETVNDYAGYLGQWIQDVRAAGKTPVLEEPGPVCDGNHPQLPQYVEAMDQAVQQYGVPIIKQYDYVSSLPDWRSHMSSCYYPDAYLDSLKAQQEEAVIAPLVKALING